MYDGGMKAENKIKLFQNSKIRTEWDGKREEWLFSVVDVVGALTEQNDALRARKYWNKLKQRLDEEGSELVTKCHQLKMVANDGKKYKTDCLYTEDILRLIQSVPSKKAEPFKQWLAQVGRERIDEINDPELAIERAMDIYLRKGYDREWILQRLQSIKIRRKLTDEWDQHGIKKGLEYAILTDEISKGWSGMTTREYKDYKGLHKESLRDNMTDMELVLNMLAETTTKELVKERNAEGLNENISVAKEGGLVAGEARQKVEEKLGRSVISAQNHQEIMALEALEELELKNTAEEDEAILYEYIKAHGGVSVAIASRIVSGISKRTVQRRLNDMVEKGMIRMVGATNNLKYVDNQESQE